MTAQVPATEPSSPGPEIAKADRPNIAILQGFIGSLLILFGSFGVGWLSLDSAELRSNPLIIWMRFD